MHQDEDEDLGDWKARNGGTVKIHRQYNWDGCTSSRIEGQYNWDGACIGSAEFCTNGPQGGTAAKGGFFRLGFTNSASTCIQVAVDGADPQYVDKVTITFGGDEEIAAIIGALDFISTKLKEAC